jgi:hypothetical protein
MSRARDIADGTFSGAFAADSPTFVVDAENNEVGIGTTNPLTKFTVSGGYISQTNAGVSTYLGEDGSGGSLAGTTTNHYFRFITNDTERARLDTSGNFLVGQSSQNFSVEGIVLYSPSDTFGPRINVTNTSDASLNLNRLSTDGSIAVFFKDTASVGSISVTASATAYNTSSDYRLKEDVQPMVGASDRLMALKPVNFAWKVDGSRVDGFLAHEAQEVVPECVTGSKDAVDDEGNPQYQGIDQSKIVPLLVAALQEAMAEIAQLKADVAALKGA